MIWRVKDLHVQLPSDIVLARGRVVPIFVVEVNPTQRSGVVQLPPWLPAGKQRLTTSALATSEVASKEDEAIAEGKNTERKCETRFKSLEI